MARAEKLAEWEKRCESGMLLDDVIVGLCDAVADATNSEMQALVGPFRAPRLENLAKKP